MKTAATVALAAIISLHMILFVTISGRWQEAAFLVLLVGVIAFAAILAARRGPTVRYANEQERKSTRRLQKIGGTVVGVAVGLIAQSAWFELAASAP